MITYRTNKSSTLHAMYCGACRVGYVEERSNGRWRWQLIVLQPQGGAYMGVADDEQEAKSTAEENYRHWMTSAGLQHKKEYT